MLPLRRPTPAPAAAAGRSNAWPFPGPCAKAPKVLIFDEATSALDAETADAFARTVNGFNSKATMPFITHALPNSLTIDEVLQIGKDGVQQLKAVVPVIGANKSNSAPGEAAAGSGQKGVAIP